MEYGTGDKPVTTGEGGRFELRLRSEATPAVLVTREDSISLPPHS